MAKQFHVRLGKVAFPNGTQNRDGTNEPLSFPEKKQNAGPAFSRGEIAAVKDRSEATAFCAVPMPDNFSMVRQ
jgi:hypothetical protein